MLVAAVFYYLFRATRARGGGIPRWFVYLIVGAPIVYALSQPKHVSINEMLIRPTQQPN